ncbi:hypothetical protein [Dietzia alimentaria]|uniref:hypothetical protein n=1 Tax=Dietzia alimentaria TaxID=665550 RepID=UPI00029A581E|nr:hypothetical protein [Dietzia alimentaria]
MAEEVPHDSLPAQWAQLAVLGLLAWFVAMLRGALAGAAVCQRIQERYRAAYGVTPDGLGCAVPGAASWALSAVVIFAVAVWWGSGRGFPTARLRLGRSMLTVAGVWFVVPAVVFFVSGTQTGTEDRAWVLGIGMAYLVASLSAGVGAWPAGILLKPAAAFATLFAGAPMLLYPVHEMFGVLVACVLTAPALGLAFAAALSSPSSKRRKVGGREGPARSRPRAE